MNWNFKKLAKKVKKSGMPISDEESGLEDSALEDTVSEADIPPTTAQDSPDEDVPLYPPPKRRRPL